MRGVWLHIAFLVVAVVVSHDVYMATTGHALIAVQATTAVDRGDPHHAHAHHAPLPGNDQPVPAGMLTHCDPVRDIASLNREMSPSFDTVPTALLPDPSRLMLFASTSRAIVEAPPSHPPDLNRAFFQVYRI